jgi:hypothetical protein
MRVSRRRFSAAGRVGLLAEYHRSGRAQREFVDQNDLSLATMTNWLRRERQGPEPPPSRHIGFAELPLPQLPQLLKKRSSFFTVTFLVTAVTAFVPPY